MAVGASESGNEEARLRFKLRSPYFIPDAVRGSSPKPGWVAVAFRYIDGEEPGRVEKVNEKVFATKGRHSGRLLALEVNIEKLGAKRANMEFQLAENELKDAWRAFGADQKPANAEETRWAFMERRAEVWNQMVNA